MVAWTGVRVDAIVSGRVVIVGGGVAGPQAPQTVEAEGHALEFDDGSALDERR